MTQIRRSKFSWDVGRYAQADPALVMILSTRTMRKSRAVTSTLKTNTTMRNK